MLASKLQIQLIVLDSIARMIRTCNEEGYPQRARLLFDIASQLKRIIRVSNSHTRHASSFHKHFQQYRGAGSHWESRRLPVSILAIVSNGVNDTQKRMKRRSRGLCLRGKLPWSTPRPPRKQQFPLKFKPVESWP
jgi:hypothetical protein